MEGKFEEESVTLPPLALPALPDIALPPPKLEPLLEFLLKRRRERALVDWTGAPATKTGLKVAAARTKEENKESFILKKVEVIKFKQKIKLVAKK